MFQLTNGFDKNKQAFVFLLKLLLLTGLLKLIFFFYNLQISNQWEITTIANVVEIITWSLFYDLLYIAAIHFLFFLTLILVGKYASKKYLKWLISLPFVLINCCMLLLNSIDIFYFRFHLQRSNADLMYVLKNPTQYGNTNIWWWVIIAVLVIIGLLIWLYKNMTALVANYSNHRRGKPYVVFSTLLGFLFITVVTGTKKLMPNYPLTKISAVQLPLTQNSFFNFVYSLYRINESTIPNIQYIEAAALTNIFSIHQKNDSVATPKNIVLFIMESVPLDFFIDSSIYKPRLPFLDSLIKKSTFFNNAFSYSYSSNKGITAILGGIPTLTDVPLYHSSFASIEKSAPGKLLEQNNYSSAFFIGDHYDDFGFAKCASWIGFGKYYSMEAIPGYKKMEQHTMGLHDEYVLNFMEKKLRTMKEPFLATQYNISTHYPNDIPSTFKKSLTKNSSTPPMLSMQYYDASLRSFFEKASQQIWFKNSVFIFCSDHWAQPHEKLINIDKIDALRIPIFIYDPSKENGATISTPVSQLDILNSLLFYGGYKEPFISYGKNMMQADSNRVVFAKLNSSLYQAINSKFVLGYDASSGKALYLYDYIADPNKQQNLIADTTEPQQAALLNQMKGFLQTATNHYKRKNIQQ